MLFDVNHYMYAGCYRGYGDGAGGFYEVYRHVFQKIHEGEVAQESASTKDVSHLPHDFGSSTTPWDDVAAFYAGWESFTSTLSFAWADPYDVKEAPSRPVRRAMDDENKKARRAAKKARNDEVQALVRFVKRRDPRVKARRQQAEEEKAERERQKKLDAQQRKRDTQIAKEQWRQQAEEVRAQAVADGIVPVVKCWLLNDCPEEARENCLAYQNQGKPCWQHFRSKDGCLKEDCLNCKVFRGTPVPVVGD